MQMFFKNIKSQKGITGAEIVISATMIVITLVVVAMIYVNTTLESRNVTRTAGATRIATNILENIEKISYTEFVNQYNAVNANKQTNGQYINYYLMKSDDNVKLFSTTIPKGYNVYIKSEPNYGSHTQLKEQFDLVRDINLIIEFSIGDNTEKLEFQTVKKREMIGEVNEPNTDLLTTSKILQTGMNYYPVKYLESSNAYVKVEENDSSWYNYSNKKWATVIVSKQSENDIFDVNGKFIGKINSNKTEYTQKYVWIPSFFTKTENDKKVFYAFAYLGTNDYKIVPSMLYSNAGSTYTLNINTYSMISSSEKVNVPDNDTFSKKTGRWIEENSITSDTDGQILNASKYGPYVSH